VGWSRIAPDSDVKIQDLIPTHAVFIDHPSTTKSCQHCWQVKFRLRLSPNLTLLEIPLRDEQRGGTSTLLFYHLRTVVRPEKLKMH
jgi:hypothetical protein